MIRANTSLVESAAAGSKIIAIDAESLLKLWIHYSDGKLPLDSELKAFAVDTILKRQLAFIVESSQWDDEPLPGKSELAPLHLRYEGKMVMSWGDKMEEPFWQNAPSKGD